MATEGQILEADVPPKLDKDVPSGRINVIASETLLQRVEEWRATQRPIPNKSEAARMLIEQGLDADARRTHPRPNPKTPSSKPD